MKALRPLALAVCAAVGSASAAPRLAQPLAVDCEPALPYFCANVHVSCSGRTDLRTFPFRLTVAADRGSIDAGAGAAGIARRYVGARVDRGPDAAYLILRPAEGAGYIKLLASGRYSFRYYDAREAGIMSYGHCR